MTLIAVLLAALVALQYGWVASLSELERQQMERTLRDSTNRFARQLEHQFEDLWYVFHMRTPLDPAQEFAEDYAEWLTISEFPELVASAYWIEYEYRLEGANVATADRFNIARISVAEARLEPVEEPPWLSLLLDPLIKSAETHRRQEFDEFDSFTATLADEGLAFVVAQTEFDSKSWAVVILRRDVLVEQFLPSLVREHFGADDERDYDVFIFDEADEDQVIYTSASNGWPAGAAPPDVVRHLDDFGGFERNLPGGGGRSLAVAVRHRAGSLETAVAQLRLRNLVFSFGVVLVLGASIVVLAAAARRTQRLAERQMEFVAGVSHELRTPIAAISSLSQNLADGLVEDLEEATLYGKSIHQENRRLANMVEGVLHFSAIRSGSYRYEMEPVNLQRVIDESLETLGPAELERFSPKVHVETDLPPLRGDARALETLVRNLVSNATKFSKAGGEIRLSVATVERRGNQEIELSISDSGRGIDGSELQQIFEPFFRGGGRTRGAARRLRARIESGQGDRRRSCRQSGGHEQPWRGQHVPRVLAHGRCATGGVG